MLNEAIISTGIYYYDEENTTESSLAFRMGVQAPMDRVEQYDYKVAREVYDLAAYACALPRSTQPYNCIGMTPSISSLARL